MTEIVVSHIAEEDEKRPEVEQEPAMYASTPKLNTLPMSGVADSDTAEEDNEHSEIEGEPATLTTTPKFDPPLVPSTLQQPSATAHTETQNDNVQASTTPPDSPVNTGFQPGTSGPAPRLMAPPPAPSPAPSSWSSDSSNSPKPGPVPPISSSVQGHGTSDGNKLINQEPDVPLEGEITGAERREWSTFSRQNVQGGNATHDPGDSHQQEITDVERDEWSTFGRQNVRREDSSMSLPFLPRQR